jgi:hypothetical protein
LRRARESSILEIDIGLANRIGADRDQIVGSVHLNAVARIVEQRDVGCLHLDPKPLHHQIQLRSMADQIKP